MEKTYKSTGEAKKRALRNLRNMIMENAYTEHGNDYHCVEYNNDSEDYTIVDNFAIGYFGAKELWLTIWNRRKDITKIEFWDGGCYKHTEQDMQDLIEYEA